MNNNKVPKIKTAVVGATGYTGLELARLLAQHPNAELCAATSRTYAGKPLSDVFPNLRGYNSLICDDSDLPALSDKVDLIFLALPHGEAASKVTTEILQKTRVIDLGADFRLLDPQQYKQWYHTEHANPSLIQEATYGLCELNREAISKARLIANPGCYATCSILAVTPLLKSNLIETNSIIIDAKSGVTGAGRALALNTHFDECNENIKAYAVASHRHTPEIEQELSRQCGQPITLTFTPHLVPMNRGILVTAYAVLKVPSELELIQAAYRDTYENAPFIRLFDSKNDEALAEPRWVKGSNYCDISIRIDKRTGRVIVVAALDNLVKGAAGQAIQNMNLMYGLDEATGLDHLPLFPS